MASSSQHRISDGLVASVEGLPQWSHEYAAAWVGLLATHRSLTRELDAQLEATHGLTISALELLVQLARTPEHWLRLSALASGSGLSLSRVSRIVDALQERGLLKRRPCDADARAINAVLTPQGLALAKAAQAMHLAAVRERFFDRLSDLEVATLATIFMRFAPDAVSACSS
jgi:DNA-binding MarR family transcriptional regulator